MLNSTYDCDDPKCDPKCDARGDRDGSTGKWKSYFDWPNGCSEEMAEKALQASLDQKCSHEKCKLFGLVCFQVDIPCRAPTVMQQNKALQKYAQQQALRNMSEPHVEVYTAQDLQQSAIWKVGVRRLQTQIDVATCAYSWYLAAAILYGAPFRYHRRGTWQGAVGRFMFGTPEYTFIVFFVLAWTATDALVRHVDPIKLANVWDATLTAPCLMNMNLTDKMMAEIVSVCNDLANARANFSRTVRELHATDLAAQAYSACFAPCWQCQAGWLDANPQGSNATYATPEVKYVLAHVLLQPEYQSSFVFPAMCNLTELRTYVNGNMVGWSRKTNVNGVDAVFQGGIISGLLIKFVLCRFLTSVSVFLQPFVLHRQGVEAETHYNTEALREEVVMKSRKYLRLGCCYWQIVSFFVEAGALAVMIWNLTASTAYWKSV